MILCTVYAADPPTPPRNVSAKDVTKSSCTITWNAPEFDGGSPITGYYVEKLSGTRWIKANREPIKKCEYPIKDLIEGSDNEYRVCAENAAGLSKPSETSGKFVAKNPFDVPGKPEAPEIMEVAETSVSLEWQPPAKDGGAPITNYIVEYKERMDIKWKTATREVKETKFVVENLKAGAEHEFRITAQNKAGAGPPSQPSISVKYGKCAMVASSSIKVKSKKSPIGICVLFIHS